jgi:diguanylate cyclase (GGDEF)-like protein
MRSTLPRFTISSLYRLETDDAELARAQFRTFSKQMPLLYCILVFNAGAIMWDFYNPEKLFETFLFPLAMCAVALVRSFWWFRQGDGSHFSDKEIAHYITRTCGLAVIMTFSFELWCMWIYKSGSIYARGHLTFFLALTTVSTVFCLMAIRAAAMRVAVTSTIGFISYFSWVDDGMMLVPAVVLAFVSFGMIVVTYRYNQDFSELVQSQRDLKTRQIETEKLSEENRQIALTDALSGLPNRRQFLTYLDGLENQTDPTANSLAIIFIDLDGFKKTNDSHGHQAGDILIRELSERLQNICPPYAKLARVGGDEFAIVIESVDAADQSFALAAKIHEAIGLPVLVDRYVLQVGASVGIAINAEEPLRPQELLRRADTAMYHAKMSGKGGTALYDAAFDKGRIQRLTIEDEIGQGLDRGEFDVFYQPVVDANSGTIVGAEALIRWPRRPAGELQPSEFIEIAEATGQIHPLGLFVLEDACESFKCFDNIQLSVNVSPVQFRDPAFEQQVETIIARTGFPAERLQLEITEGYLLTDPERAISAIQNFKSMGMSIALDDFGTGFTSIHYLQSYGFSHIKIDKSLLDGLGPDTRASLLITGATYLASGLDMEVIAEGVETEDQAALLRLAGCHKLQGFWFGKPMALDDFRTALIDSDTMNESAFAFQTVPTNANALA